MRSFCDLRYLRCPICDLRFFNFNTPNLIQRADTRMIQRRNGPRFALKSLAKVGPIREMSGQNFDGNDAIQARVSGFVDFSMPPAPMGERIS